jgi:hypothetical protein
MLGILFNKQVCGLYEVVYVRKTTRCLIDSSSSEQMVPFVPPIDDPRPTPEIPRLGGLNETLSYKFGLILGYFPGGDTLSLLTKTRWSDLQIKSASRYREFVGHR